MTLMALSFVTAWFSSANVVGAAVMPGLGEQLLVVPEALDTHPVRQAVLSAVDLPDAGRAADVGDLGLGLVGDVLEVSGVHLFANLTAAPRLEDVRRVVGQQRGRDTRALELIGLDRLDLDRDGRDGGR